MVLKKGSKGSDVTKLQQGLKNLGYYSGAIDGDFGSKTEAAVIAFQKNNAVVVDGVVGDETQAGIQQKNWILKRPILQQGAKGKDVELLQNILQQAEDISPQLQKPIKLNVGAIDGDFGPKTKAAVIKFQSYEQIGADGIVGGMTWNRLSFILTFDLAPEVIYANNLFVVA